MTVEWRRRALRTACVRLLICRQTGGAPGAMSQFRRTTLTASGGALPRLEPTVAVVVLNWNSETLTERCLSSILAQRGVNAIPVVVDNGSNRASIEFLRTRFPGVHIILNPQNLGFARAC